MKPSSIKNIAIIPCRGGSKRIPDKNIKFLKGKPLLAYAIEAALQSTIFDIVVVSTDSEKIAKVAIEYGATVPFMRDTDLADDFSPVSLATVDALKKIDRTGNKYHNVAQLMANCPLRNAEDVCASYKEFIIRNVNAQISVTEYGWLTPWWAMTSNPQHVLTPLFKEQTSSRSQDLPKLYCPTGAIWWAKTLALRTFDTFYTPDYTGWTIPWERSIDIDTTIDWKMAEFLLEQQHKNI